MKKHKSRGKRGRYVSDWRRAEYALGVALILLVAWWHLHDATNSKARELDAMRHEYIELLHKVDALEQEAVKASNTIAEPEKWRTQYEVKVSAYNTVEAQTDDSPCISADGSDVCKLASNGHCIVAHNTLPLGTRINLNGFGECTVRDRMNARYGAERMDVLMGKDVQKAREWGVQKLTYRVID